jgi:membrane protein
VNQIWKVRSVRGYRQKIMAFTMLFFWGPVLMGVSFTSTSVLEKNRYLRVLFKDDIIFRVVPVAVMFIAFAMLFWLVPSTQVKLKAAMIGSVITTALFTLVRFGFGIYARHLFTGRFNLIYGTVGLALIFLIAIEIMWVVILLGVEISYVYQNLYGVLRATEQRIEDEPRFDLYFAMRALVEIARRFDKREEPPSSYRLAEQFGTTDAQMRRILRRLEDMKLLKEIPGVWPAFVPACDPDRMTVEEVILGFEGWNRSVPDIAAGDEHRAVGDLFTRVSDCTRDALEHLSIGRVVRELYGDRAPSRAEDRGALRGV